MKTLNVCRWAVVNTSNRPRESAYVSYVALYKRDAISRFMDEHRKYKPKADWAWWKRRGLRAVRVWIREVRP